MAFMLWVLVAIAVVTVDRGIQHGSLTVKWQRGRPGQHLDLIDNSPTLEDRVTSMHAFMTYYKVTKASHMVKSRGVFKMTSQMGYSTAVRHQARS